MKINKKIVIVNIIILVIVYLLLELLSILINTYNYKENISDFIKSDHPKLLNIYFPQTLKEQNPQKYEYPFREPFIFTNNNKNSILIYGCSFANGDGLSNEESLGGVLARLTKRNVYNRAHAGLGPQMMLYDFQTKKCKDVADDTEYIIYLFMDDHTNRILMFRCWPFLHKVSVKYLLNKKTGELNLIKPNFYQTYSYVYRLIESYIPSYTSVEDADKLFYEIIKQSYIESKKLYPNSKFIILDYSNFPIPKQKELENLGINVISVKDLTDKNLFSLEYQISKYDTHPNKKVWEELTPVLIKKLKM